MRDSMNFSKLRALILTGLIALGAVSTAAYSADVAGSDPRLDRVVRPGKTIKIPEEAKYDDEANLPPRGNTSATNLALNRPARQSSLSQWSTGPDDALGGNDGKKSGEPRFGFHTSTEN